MRISFLAATILFTLVACNKNDLPIGNGDRLEKVITTWGDSVAYTFLKYDQYNRLIHIFDSNNHKKPNVTNTSIVYNTGDKILNYTRSDEKGYQWSSSFRYNTDGHVTEQMENGPNGPILTNRYTYDTRGRLIADTSYYRNNSIISYSTYKYDNNDNVVEWEHFLHNNLFNTLDRQWTVYFSYDTKLNSYRNLNRAVYFMGGRPELLSKNNLLRMRYNTVTIDYKYEYYNTGLPKRISLEKNDSNIPSFTEFFFH